MLLSLKSQLGQSLAAKDGEIGKVIGFYFDDHAWFVRYLVVQTGRWLGRHVLIARSAVGVPDPDQGVLPVGLTRDQVKQSPDVATDKPISSQMEEQLSQHYGWPVWYALPGGPIPVPPPSAPIGTPGVYDPHLRSSEEVIGYHIHASDGDIGHVEDFVFDDEEWGIRYLVVDTRNWLPGRKVLVPPSLIHRIDWADSKVELGLTRERVENGPRYDSSEPVTRDREEAIISHYGRPAYWRR